MTIHERRYCDRAYDALRLVKAQVDANAHEEVHAAIERLQGMLTRMELAVTGTEAMADVLKKTDKVPPEINTMFRQLQICFGMKDTRAWLATRPGLTILEPDGWDNGDSVSDYENSMSELITEEEFDRRLSLSKTCDEISGEIEPSSFDPGMPS